jgi:beta-phosphoglucomutase-like phosphatase (HAD superfamily)
MDSIQALVFDFDGLMVDTESPEFQAWHELYAAFGADLPFEVWSECIGRAGDYFDPIAFLEQQLGREVDRDLVRTREVERKMQLVLVQPLCAGVADYVRRAQQLGLRLAVASSSSHAWVEGHLERLGVRQPFHAILCREDVPLAKPNPALYQAALAALSVEPGQALALEDSPNGIAAAVDAGIFCVAVPNPLTARLDLSRANLRLSSLAAMPLPELLQQVQCEAVG